MTWTWTPDSGTGGLSPGPCGWDQQSCTRTCSKSGWKKLTVVTSGYTLTDSVHVQLIPCPTNRDPLDQPLIRQALVDAYDRAKSTNQEQVVAVFYNPTSGYFVMTVPTSYASACRANFTPPSPENVFPDDDLIAIAHTHPGKPQSVQHCPEKGNYVVGEGGSSDDWKYFKKLQNEPAYQAAGWSDLEYWVIDGNNVYVMEAGSWKGSELKAGRKFPWNTPQCQWYPIQ